MWGENVFHLIERFSIKCRKGKTKPIIYQFELSANLKPYSKTKTEVIAELPSTLKWKPLFTTKSKTFKMFVKGSF